MREFLKVDQKFLKKEEKVEKIRLIQANIPIIEVLGGKIRFD